MVVVAEAHRFAPSEVWRKQFMQRYETHKLRNHHHHHHHLQSIAHCIASDRVRGCCLYLHTPTNASSAIDAFAYAHRSNVIATREKRATVKRETKRKKKTKMLDIQSASVPCLCVRMPSDIDVVVLEVNVPLPTAAAFRIRRMPNSCIALSV